MNRSGPLSILSVLLGLSLNACALPQGAEQKPRSQHSSQQSSQQSSQHGQRTNAGTLPKVVSLNPCTDAMLVAIARPDQVLGISHYSHNPKASSMEVALARLYRATGGTVEEVLALDPDMVLASQFLAPSSKQALEAMGIEVVTFSIASSVEQSLDQIDQLGGAIGRPRQAQQLGDKIAQSVQVDPQAAADEQEGEAAPAPRVIPKAGATAPDITAVLWQAGGIVPGEQTLVSELMRRAGLANHSAQRGMAQADYLGLEQLLADPPDVLLIAGDMPGQNHPALRHIPQMQIAQFDPSLLYCGGPSIPPAMARLREIRGQVQ